MRRNLVVPEYNSIYTDSGEKSVRQKTKRKVFNIPAAFVCSSRKGTTTFTFLHCRLFCINQNIRIIGKK